MTISNLSKEEKIRLEKYVKKLGLKNINQLLRRGLEDLIGISKADSSRNKQALPGEYLEVYNFEQLLEKEYQSNREVLEKIKASFQKWKTKFFIAWTRKENEELRSCDKDWEIFRDNHKNPGRPKGEKRKPGRPKEQGY